MEDGVRTETLSLRQLEFDPEARLVIVPGQQTLLDPRSSTVLLTLMRKFGQRIDKDELLRAAWPKQVVHENSLAKAISKLRRAIRGSGVEIAVSYGSGYTLRYVPVLSTDQRKSRFAASRQSLGREQGRSRFWLTAATATFGVAVIVTAGLYAFVWPERASAIRLAPPITSDAPDALATILWVDDHPSNNRSEVAFFKGRRIAVHIAESTEDALALLAMNSYQLVISDLGRGEDRLAGLRMIEAMKQHQISVPVIIYTVRPKLRRGQEAQANLVAAAGSKDLAVTPQEVRVKVLELLGRSVGAPN